jgi:hypothetical protein
VRDEKSDKPVFGAVKVGLSARSRGKQPRKGTSADTAL